MFKVLLICGWIFGLIVGFWSVIHPATLVPFGIVAGIVATLLFWKSTYLDDSIQVVTDQTAIVVDDPENKGKNKVHTEKGVKFVAPDAVVKIVNLDPEKFDLQVKFKPKNAADDFTWDIGGRVQVIATPEKIREFLGLDPKNPKKAFDEAKKLLIDALKGAITTRAQAVDQTDVNGLATEILKKALEDANNITTAQGGISIPSPMRISASITRVQKSKEDEEQDELRRKFGDYQKSFNDQLKAEFPGMDLASWETAWKMRQEFIAKHIPASVQDPSPERNLLLEDANEVSGLNRLRRKPTMEQLQQMHSAALYASGLYFMSQNQLQVMFGQHPNLQFLQNPTSPRQQQQGGGGGKNNKRGKRQGGV